MIRNTRILVAAFSTIFLVSCGTTKKATTAAPSTAVIHAKKGELTEDQLKRWSHLDIIKDSIPGMSVDRAYAELLKDKKGQKVIVGVIDSGVDIGHEDYKGVIWTNTKEIAGNNIDDDNNGYVDDINGWNFLGDSNNENLEMTRIVKKGASHPDYQKAKAAYDEEYRQALAGKQQVDFIFNAFNDIEKQLGKSDYTLADVQGISSTDANVNRSKMVVMSVIAQAGPGFKDELDAFKKHVSGQTDYNLNLSFDGRKLVGDNPDDIKDKKYGNNVVVFSDKEESLHGTHVAGIIAQVRGNGLGGDGVCSTAEIMAIRAVPNGDEYDKDIALAIRYAVDNGAKVINGSFGKSFSPNREWVYDAIKYAASKDVLFVHAAGNDAHDVDLAKYENFPNDSKDQGLTEIANNVLTIGALANTYGENLVASFSNYGARNVDIFAPGQEIYATTPNNSYKYEQGTSMASPNAAGVAALIRSYYPNLTAAQVKQIIMESGTPINISVKVGEDQQLRQFSQVCKSGKIVNAYNALILAEKMSK